MGRQAVVTLPGHIDASNAGQVSEQLLSVINRGATELIADMTATASCDHAGADAVVRAYQRAAANGTQLRLVITAQIVRRVLSLNGLDRVIPVYPSLEAATAAAVPATVIAFTPTPPAVGDRQGQRPGSGRPGQRAGHGPRPSPGRCSAGSSTPSPTGWPWPATMARSRWSTGGLKGCSATSTPS
jgi:anti-sigma B factor antagonist